MPEKITDRGKPWHASGYMFKPEDSWDSFYEKGGLLFEAEKQPLSIRGTNIIVPDKVAIVRSDRDDATKVLGYTSPDYSIVQYSESLVIPKQLQEFLEPEACGVFGNGEIGWVLARLKNHSFEPIKGDEVVPYLLQVSSHNGVVAYQPGLVTERSISGAAFRHSVDFQMVRHSKNALDRLEAVKKTIMTAIIETMKFQEHAAILASIQMNDAQWKEYLDLIMPNPRRAARTEATRLALTGLFEAGTGQDIPGVRGTAWAAFNAVTEYVTWHRGTRLQQDYPTDSARELAQDDSRWQSNLLGSGNKWAAEAIKRLTALVMPDTVAA